MIEDYDGHGNFNTFGDTKTTRLNKLPRVLRTIDRISKDLWNRYRFDAELLESM